LAFWYCFASLWYINTFVYVGALLRFAIASPLLRFFIASLRFAIAYILIKTLFGSAFARDLSRLNFPLFIGLRKG
jgi:hypothetical protein